jgi:hypothetical protein
MVERMLQGMGAEFYRRGGSGQGAATEYQPGQIILPITIRKRIPGAADERRARSLQSRERILRSAPSGGTDPDGSST